MRVEHVDCELVDIAVPYVAGFLGFREVPSYLRLLERCPAAGRPQARLCCCVAPAHSGTPLLEWRVLRTPQSAAPHPSLQVLLVDGFGVLHPRRCGSASHLGVLTGVPCVGVGKSLLHVDGLDERTVRAHALLALGRVQPGEASASAQPRDESAATGIGEAVTLSETAVMLPLLSASGGEVLGAALCGQAGSTRPIYISVGAPGGSSTSPRCSQERTDLTHPAGHKVTLQTAVALTLACCVHRIPEPIRQADLRSREFIRQQASGAGAGAGAVQV